MIILCIEDSPVILDTYRDLAEDLHDQGIHFIFADSYKAACAAVDQAAGIDYVISDWEFPGEDAGSMKGGLDFYRWFKRDPRGQDIPFVFLSGSPENEIKDALQSGALTPLPHGFFAKPFTLVEVVQVLQRRFGASTPGFVVPGIALTAHRCE